MPELRGGSLLFVPKRLPPKITRALFLLASLQILHFPFLILTFPIVFDASSCHAIPFVLGQVNSVSYFRTSPNWASGTGGPQSRCSTKTKRTAGSRMNTKGAKELRRIGFFFALFAEQRRRTIIFKNNSAPFPRRFLGCVEEYFQQMKIRYTP